MPPKKTHKKGVTKAKPKAKAQPGSTAKAPKPKQDTTQKQKVPQKAEVAVQGPSTDPGPPKQPGPGPDASVSQPKPPAPKPPAPSVQVVATVKELSQASQRKLRLADELQAVEKQIYDLETRYLENSHPLGNALKGYEGLLTNSLASSRRILVRQEDRLFSNSSLSSAAK